MKDIKGFVKDNKSMFIIIGAVLLVLLVFGMTLAYFVAQVGTGAQAEVNVETATTDILTFQTGNDINIGPVTQENFFQGAGSKSGSTTASATLRANNSTNIATETYNLYINITNNTFEKTHSDAELLLVITDPRGTVVNSLNGLTYTTVNGMSGFDVTEKTGLIQVASNYSINVSSQQENPKTDTWNMTLIFVNLDDDQSENGGARFQAQAIIQKEVYE